MSTVMSEGYASPEITTLRKLRLRYNISISVIAEAMGVEEDYVERLEERGDCFVSELRAYSAAINGNARVSVKVFRDGKLYLLDLGYRPGHMEIPEVYGVDMPRLPACSEEIKDFEAVLLKFETDAFRVTSDRNADKRSRAMGFSARNSVAILRSVMKQYGPRLEMIEKVYDYLDRQETLDPEAAAIYDEIADLMGLEEPEAT